MSEIINLSSNNSQPLTKKGEKTRQHLLNIAEEVFGEKGYFNASIVDITQKANVAQGTFYNYFPSKQSIFEELVRNMSHTFRSEIRSAIKTAGSFEESQRIGFRTFFSWVNEVIYLLNYLIIGLFARYT